MQRSGFTCYYVTGRTDSSSMGLGGSNDNGAHSWDIVLVAGEYYNVDCLWDDTASDTYGSAIYPFFNVPDEELVNHNRINMAVRLPQCTATDYRYSNLFGPTVEASSIVFTEAG
jgi:transglutaminase/protease-like cytokinesis protein 3